jgi:hypothetical protein
MKAKLKKNYSYWEKDQIFNYKIKFDIYHMSLRQKDGFYYELFTMEKDIFKEYFMDLNEERKLKILKLNKSIKK